MKKNILKASALVFSLSLIAKLIAFLKSILQASYFGTDIYTDAFNVTSGFVSNILYMFTTALAVAFVPLYIQHKTEGEDKGKEFASKSITALFIITIAMTVVMVIAAPLIIKFIAPSYEGEIYNTSIRYFQVLCLGICFSFIANLFTNLLNSEKIYGYSAACSIVNSIVLIIFILLFSATWGVWTLVISMPVSYLVQWVVLYLRGRKYATFTFRYGLRDKSLKILFFQAAPILMSQATVEINQVVDRTLLTSVGAGVVTAVSYSAVLYQFASTLVTAPLSTVMFTELAETAANKNEKGIKEILNSCYSIMTLLCIPIVAIIYFCANDIVGIVYGHGSFTAEAVDQCAVGLAMYGLCLFPVCIKTVLSRAYYSMNDTRRPMIIGILEVVLNIMLSILLVRRFGIIGVVGATALASLVFVIVMLIDFNIKYIKVFSVPVICSYWKKTVGFLVMAVILYSIKDALFFNMLVDFILKTLIAFAVDFFVLIILRDSTMMNLLRKMWKGILKR